MSGLAESSTDARSKTIGKNFRCRAWVSFNGTGTVAIRDSGNVSSISDLSTGRYEVNLTSAMPDTDYAVLVDGNVNGSNVDTRRLSRTTHFYTSGVKLVCGSTIANSEEEWEFISVAFFR